MPSLSRYLTVLLLSVLALQGNCQQFASSNLPIVVINTHGLSIQDEPKVIVDMGIIYNGEGVRNFLTDPQNNFRGKIAIEIRGSSSQMFPKKQYGFELRGADGNDLDTTLLGLPPDHDWILFAPYNDKSLMRDVLAYELGRDLGRYAPRTRYCELVLNGSYEGVYVLIEKVKRDLNRVDIAKLEPGDNTGDEVTGGYIIKIDKPTGGYDPGWFSAFPPKPRGGDQRINFLYHYPDAYKITAAQRTYIQGFIGDFELSLKAENFRDPLNGYARFIDVGSFVDFFIINEISKNVDGYRLSTYLHKQRNSDGGKLFMGPVWDFNLGFGNADYCTQGAPYGLVLSFNEVCYDDWWLIPFWWDRLFDDPAFAKKVKVRWTEIRNEKFSDDRITTMIDSIANVLSESQVRNFQRWPVLGQYVWPNYFVGQTYIQEVNWLKAWVEQRTAWLDAHIGGLVTGIEPLANSTVALETIHPNPSAGDFNFRFRISEPAWVRIELFDLPGRKVESSRQTLLHTPGAIVGDVGKTLVAGTYFYRIISNNKAIAFGKLIKN